MFLLIDTAAHRWVNHSPNDLPFPQWSSLICMSSTVDETSDKLSSFIHWNSQVFYIRGHSSKTSGRKGGKCEPMWTMCISESVSESNTPPPRIQASGWQYICVSAVLFGAIRSGRLWTGERGGGVIIKTDDVGQVGGRVPKKSFFDRTSMMNDPKSVVIRLGVIYNRLFYVTSKLCIYIIYWQM